MQKLTQADIIRKWFEIVNQPDVQAEDVKAAVRLARWVEAQYTEASELDEDTEADND